MNRLCVALFAFVISSFQLFSLDVACPHNICTNPDRNREYDAIFNKMRSFFSDIIFDMEEPHAVFGYEFTAWDGKFAPRNCNWGIEDEITVIGYRCYMPKYYLTWFGVDDFSTEVERKIEVNSFNGSKD